MFTCSWLERWFVVAGGLLFFLSTTYTSALQYQRVPVDPPLIGIAATGPIVPGDFDRLDAFIGKLPKTELLFFIDSPGGNIFEAEKSLNSSLLHSFQGLGCGKFPDGRELRCIKARGNFIGYIGGVVRPLLDWAVDCEAIRTDSRASRDDIHKVA
jgi:hypothetical protein